MPSKIRQPKNQDDIKGVENFKNKEECKDDDIL